MTPVPAFDIVLFGGTGAEKLDVLRQALAVDTLPIARVLAAARGVRVF